MHFGKIAITVYSAHQDSVPDFALVDYSLLDETTGDVVPTRSGLDAAQTRIDLSEVAEGIARLWSMALDAARANERLRPEDARDAAVEVKLRRLVELASRGALASEVVAALETIELPEERRPEELRRG